MENSKSYCGFNRKRGYLDMLESNYADVKKFVAEKRRNECSENTLRMYTGLISEFEEQINKPFRNVTEDDVNTFIDRKAGYSKKGTMATTKMVIKAFYKWLFDLKDTYPQCVAKLEVNGRKNGNDDASDLDVKDIMVKDDIVTLINRAKNVRNEAIVSTLYESGARVGEFCRMLVGDLVPAKHGFKITVNGKTGKRTVLLTESVPYIMRYLEHHPFKDNPNAPLWVNGDAPHGGLHVGHIAFITRQIGKASGIHKPTHPHMFRHARATFLARFLSDSQMKVYFGWSKNSNMVAIYVHLSGRDNDTDVLRSAGIVDEEDTTEQSPLSVQECPRCKTKNTGTAMFCELCGKPLKEDTSVQDAEVDDIKAQVSKLTDLVTKLLQNPQNERRVVDSVTDLTIAMGEEQRNIHERRQRTKEGKCTCGAEAQGQPTKVWMLGPRTQVSQYVCTNGHKFQLYEKLTLAPDCQQ
jgi:site-specific recombinase XerD